MAEIVEEQQVKRAKRLLEGWRMALIPLKSVFLWEEQWHPWAILLFLSVLFLIIWLMDLSTLATFAVIGLFINFLDFVIPTLCNTIYGPTSWTGQKEKMFEDICKSIVANYNSVQQRFHSFYSLRENSPLLYYVLSISLLCTVAWMAAYINNIFLLYILSVVIFLWPGIQHKGIFNHVLSYFKTPLTNLKSE